MSEQAEKERIGDLLAAYAARAVPDDSDLWPAIATRLEIRQRRVGWAHLRRRVHVPRPLRRLVIMPIAAILLVGLLIATGFPWSRTEDGAVIELLNNLSAVAAAQPAESTDPIAGYYYMKTQGASLGISTFAGSQEQTFAVLVPSTREEWIAPDGSGRIIQTAEEPIFLGQRDRIRWQAAGSPNLARPLKVKLGPGEQQYDTYRHLPPDPKALAAAIREQAIKTNGPPVDVEMFVLMADLLRAPGVPPAVRAALFKVAGQIKGVELVGKVNDRAGRPGVAVARTTNNWGPRQRDTLIFDPTTSQLLSEERILLDRADYVDAEPPALIGYSLYLESKVVPTLPDDPSFDSLLPGQVVVRDQETISELRGRCSGKLSAD
ncbi:MAG: hypothetical protein EPO21_23390 [Chloroflexota bacterium]|nr:MAG: hypothetical protein EPO21_23390 [Chloroflexota bacterium]